MDLTQAPLQAIIASCVSRVMHEHGPAIRISEGGKIIQLVAKDEEERDKCMSAITLRLAPLSAIRHCFKAEIRLANSASMEVFLCEAAKELVRLDTECGISVTAVKGVTLRWQSEYGPPWDVSAIAELDVEFCSSYCWQCEGC